MSLHEHDVANGKPPFPTVLSLPPIPKFCRRGSLLDKPSTTLNQTYMKMGCFAESSGVDRTFFSERMQRRHRHVAEVKGIWPRRVELKKLPKILSVSKPIGRTPVKSTSVTSVTNRSAGAAVKPHKNKSTRNGNHLGKNKLVASTVQGGKVSAKSLSSSVKFDFGIRPCVVLLNASDVASFLRMRSGKVQGEVIRATRLGDFPNENVMSKSAVGALFPKEQGLGILKDEGEKREYVPETERLISASVTVTPLCPSEGNIENCPIPDTNNNAPKDPFLQEVKKNPWFWPCVDDELDYEGDELE